MTKQEFCEKLIILLQEKNSILQDAQITQVDKVNVHYNAITLPLQKDKNISVSFPIDTMYNDFIQSIIDLPACADQVYETYMQQQSVKIPSTQLTKEYVLRHVNLRVVSLQMNEHLLKDVPYETLLDLAVLPYVDFEGQAVTVVTYNLINSLKIAPDELMTQAHRNLEADDYIVKNIINALYGDDASGYELYKDLPKDMADTPKESTLYVLSVFDGRLGARLLLRDDALCALAEACGDSRIYVIPSSVHEVLGIPVGVDVSDLQAITHDVNQYCVEKCDFLSDTIYMYDACLHTLSCV